MKRAQQGDKVRILSGRYKDSVGTYDEHHGVYIEHVGYTGNIHPGRNVEVVSSSTPDRNVENGKDVGIHRPSPAMAAYHRMVANGPLTDEQMDAYNRQWKGQAEITTPNRRVSLGALLFGRNNTRFLWKRIN